MREHPVASKLRKEAARGKDDGTGRDCCYAPWTCCDPAVLMEAADALDRQRAHIQKLERRIHNQRASNRVTWEIVEMRRRWMGSRVVFNSYQHLVKRYRRLLNKYEGRQFAENMMSD